MTQARPATTAQAIASVRWDGPAPVIIDQRRLPEPLVELAPGHGRRPSSTRSGRWPCAVRRDRDRGRLRVVVGLGEAGPATRDARGVLDSSSNGSVAPARPPSTCRGPVRRVAEAARAARPGQDHRATPRSAEADRDPRGGPRWPAPRSATTAAGCCRSTADPDPLQHRPARDRRRRHGPCRDLRASTRPASSTRSSPTEARPLLQGGRLTAWELGRLASRIRLIVDGAAGAAMARGLVDAVIVGCDRVAANGDTANKIGTLLARGAGPPPRHPVLRRRPALAVRSPDARTATRSSSRSATAAEVRGFGERSVAPPDASAWNPAFDVTPAELIDAFVTDAGIIEPPYDADDPRGPRDDDRTARRASSSRNCFATSTSAAGSPAPAAGSADRPTAAASSSPRPASTRSASASTTSSRSIRPTAESSSRPRTTASAPASATRSSASPPASAAPAASSTRTRCRRSSRATSRATPTTSRSAISRCSRASAGSATAMCTVCR